MAITGTDITRAAELLCSGQVVAIPTETVYGLAGNGLDEGALLTIFKVKNRPRFDPLILHIGNLDQLDSLVTEVPEQAWKLAEAYWPGPLTLLLDKKPSVPDIATSGLSRVALRVPAHPLTQSLLADLPFPLAAPSANPFGYISPTTARHVNDQLGEAIPYILDGGECEVGIESTIIGFDEGNPVVHRLGGMSLEVIETVTGPLSYQLNQGSNPAAPGMLDTHYAPGKPLFTGDIEQLLQTHEGKRLGVLSWRRDYQSTGIEHAIVLSPQGSLEQAACRLFAALRNLDKAPVDVIIAERLPDIGLGRAINDRLLRASCRGSNMT